MRVRVGFDKKAALVMYRAHRSLGELSAVSETAFIRKLRKAPLFMGLYESGPVGAFVCDGADVHVALDQSVRGKSDDAIRECVQIAHQYWGGLTARIKRENMPALRLADRMGFMRVREDATHIHMVKSC